MNGDPALPARKRRLAAMCVAGALGAAGGAATATGDDELVYVTRRGDTLVGIGQRVLVDPRHWPQVQRLNRVEDPRRMPTGVRLRIPAALVRALPADATVVQIEGEARSAGAALAPGAKLVPGTEVTTGKDGFVTIELADGSRLVLQAQSRLRIRELARYPGIAAHRSAIDVDEGRVESKAAPQRDGGRFEIRTPLATTAVRGTEYRVAADGAAKVTRSEVLAGGVSVAGAGTPVRVGAGFGTVVDERRVPSAPVKLLPAPDLAGLPPLQERVVLRFDLVPVAGAAGYRAQIARDRAFQAVVADAVFPGPALRFDAVPDADYWLRVRAVDARALEGADGYHAFRLKARPEPPFPSAPRNDGKASGESVQLAWSASGDAASYRVQLARDASFRELVAEARGLAATELRVDGLVPGDYVWRVASVRADGDQGPFGDPQRFTQKPLPAMPAPPSMDDKQIAFRWAGEPGQTFRLQVAADAKFETLLADLELTTPEALLPKPEPGAYYMRVRATDPDGYVGPYTATQRFEVAPDPPPGWINLLPLIILVPLLL